MFVKKAYEVPIYSNNSLLCAWSDLIETRIKLVDGKLVPKLASQFHDVDGLRTVTYLENLAKMEKLKTLMHPLISGPSIEDLDDSQEVITLLERDSLKEFQF